MQTALQKAREAYPNASTEEKVIYNTLFGKEKFIIKTNRPETFAACHAIFKKMKFKDADLLILQRRNVKELTASDRLQICAEVWRNGWKVNYKDGNQKKWFTVFEYQDDVSGFVFSGTGYGIRNASTNGGARLAMQTEELAEKFSKTFLSEFNQSFTIKY